MNLHAPNADGFFPILSLHRDDVAVAVTQFGPADVFESDDDQDFDVPSLAATEFADAISDEGMEYLASKLGDDLMNGGDYYEALAERAIDQHWTGAA